MCDPAISDDFIIFEIESLKCPCYVDNGLESRFESDESFRKFIVSGVAHNDLEEFSILHFAAKTARSKICAYLTDKVSVGKKFHERQNSFGKIRKNKKKNTSHKSRFYY